MVQELILTKGHVALVDDDDFGLVSEIKWHAIVRPSNVYASGNPWGYRGRTVLLHRFVMSATPEIEIDHRNGIGTDCQRANLRMADRFQNQANARISSRNTSGFKGVTWSKAQQRWVAGVFSKGKYVFRATFESVEEAAMAYDEIARVVYGEFAALNFPKPGERGVHG